MSWMYPQSPRNNDSEDPQQMPLFIAEDEDDFDDIEPSLDFDDPEEFEEDEEDNSLDEDLEDTGELLGDELDIDEDDDA